MANSKFVIGKDCPIADVVKCLKSCPSFHMFHDKIGDLVLELGTDRARAKKLKDDYRLNMYSLTDVVHELVEEWATRNGSNATLQELTRALKEIELNNCAELLENKLTLKEAEASCSSPKVKKLKVKKYRQLPSGLQEFLNGPRKFCILHTLDKNITWGKISDNGVNCAYHDWKSFVGLISTMEMRDKNLVDIVKNCTLNNLGMLGRVVDGASSDNDNKVVFLTCADEHKLNDVVVKLANWENIVTICYDKMPWSDLTLASQIEITEKIDEMFKTDFQDVELSGNLLVDLINGKDVDLFKNTIPIELSYYVGRRVQARYFISVDIFKHTGPDIFLFSGMERYELTKRAGASLTDSTSNQLMQTKLSVRYMTLEQKSHFDKISPKTTDPVHLLRYENDMLRWIKSRGGMRAIQNYVDKAQDEQDEEIFCKIVSEDVKEAVCISDSPGMGKSVLLARIGSLLKSSFLERTIFFVVITELIKQIKELGGLAEAKTVHHALRLIVCENVIGEAVLTSKLSQQTDNDIIIELLLDGFDEVDSTDIKLAYELLSIIKTSFTSIRMWITSRPHFLHELENHLGILGYNIQPFNEDDQEQFLTSFWSRTGSPETDRLRIFANRCLNSLKTKMSSVEQDIAGIPLQCLLIGEVYEKDALEYSAMNSESSSSILIDVGTITTLYQRVVDKKLEKYKTVYGEMDFDKNVIIELHAGMSLELIFPKEFEKLKHLLRPIQLGEVIKVGIVESIDTAKLESARFIHRTFAEYFIAWLVTDSLKNRKQYEREVCNFFMSTIFTTSTNFFRKHALRYPVINYFINDIIIDYAEQVPTDISDHIIHMSKQLPDTMTKITNACAIGDNVNIMQFFDDLNAFNYHACRIFDEYCLLLASRISCLELVKIVLRHFEEHNQFVQHIKLELLGVIVRRGEYSILEFFIKEKGFRELVEDLNVGTGMLLHDCIKDTGRDEKLKIDQRIQVMRMLVGINSDLLEVKDAKGITPILERSAHVELLKELIRLKANVLVQDSGGYTILHLKDYYLYDYSAEDYHSVITQITQEYLRKLVKIEHAGGYPPLHDVIYDLNPLPETIQIFKEAVADFNHVNHYGHSILQTVIKKLRPVDTLRNLISCGSDVNGKDNDNGNTLLHIAAEYGHLDATKLLLDEHGFNVNVKNFEGDTPLTCLINSWETDGKRFETGLYLHERGGQYRKYINYQTCLHYAAERGNVCSTRLLLNLNEDVNAVNEEGNTPLHCAVASPRNHMDIISLILDSGANANIPNNRGKTAFDLAFRNRDLDIRTLRLLKESTDVKWTPSLAHFWLLVNLNAGMEAEEGFNSVSSDCSPLGVTLDWNYEDEMGNSLLHMTACHNYLGVCMILIEKKGVDVNSRNIKKQTALHFAADGAVKNADVIMYLIERGADVFAVDNQNLTFLHVFLLKEFIQKNSLKSIFSHIARKNYFSIFEIKGGVNETTPLHLAMYFPDEIQEELASLHTSGINFDTRDKHGHNCLFYAIRSFNNCSKLLPQLTKFGADYTALDNNRNSLLHLAAQFGMVDSLKYFLAFKNLNVNGVNCHGNTSLHSAILNRRTWIVKALCRALIDSGADITAKNKEGYNPLAFALEKQYEEEELNSSYDEELMRMLGAPDQSGSEYPDTQENIMSRVTVASERLANVQKVIKDEYYFSEFNVLDSAYPTTLTFH